MRYRADIDGLRAVAVLLVVLFHAGMPLLTGGFIGVDVFFVISGYLITRLIVIELDGPGFSILNFYERRIRRIFPALLTVLIACLAIGYVILMPSRYVDLGRSIVSVSLFASNILFWKSTDYFNPNADTHLLLHTWSLAVEEQYYVFYPILLMLLFQRRACVRPALIAITLASFVLAAVLVTVKPSATFYLLPTRTWELMIGGLVALAPRTTSAQTQTNSLLAAVGLMLVLVPAFAYDTRTPFPGLTALPPVIGTALLIWSGAERAAGVSRLLAAAPVVLVGTISYALYLWHFPLLGFARYLGGGVLTPGPAIVACLLSLAAAYASFHLVERPFRRHGLRPAARFAAVGLPVAGMIAAGLAGLAITSAGGLPARLDPVAAAIARVADDESRHHRECMSVGTVIVQPSRACRLGDPAATPSALLWGDSHAMITATAMEVAAKAQRAAFLFAATADCPVGLGFAISETTVPTLTTTPSYRYCATYNRAMLARALANPAIRHVVLSARWTNWRIGEPPGASENADDLRLVDDTGVAQSPAAQRAMYERGFRELLRRLAAAGKHVHIVGPVPEPATNVPEALYVSRFGLAPLPADLTIRGYLRRHATILAMFRRIGASYPVDFIMPVSRLCDAAGSCPLSINGVPQYLDHNHLSVAAARRTAPLYAVVFAPD